MGGVFTQAGSFSTELGCPRHVRFPPVSDHGADIAGCHKRAINRHQLGPAYRSKFQTRIDELAIGEAEGKRLAFRVGVNIGDVIVEAHDIFGDGVNIAARLESIAAPGGISISSSVYDYVR